MRILFWIGLMFTASVVLGDSLTALRKPCRELESRRETTREAAVKRLVEAEDNGAKALAAFMDTKSTAYRLMALDVLVKIPGEETGRVLAERAVKERNDKVQKHTIELLKANPSAGAKGMLIQLAQDASPGIRRSAASIIVSLKDPSYIDALIQHFGSQLKQESAGGVGLNASVSRVQGYDNYDQKYRISTPNGPKTVTQKMRMPIVSGVSISTYAGLPAGQALVEVTGKNFGKDLDKWQGWWQKNRRHSRK